MRLLPFFILVCLSSLVGADPSASRPDIAADVANKRKKPRRPNILMLLTDDQDVMVGGMAHMPILQQLLKDRGTSFDNAFVHTPICCPSRSSIMSGRYLHNGGALNNTVEGNCYGLEWQQNAEQVTFATVLQQAGYQTAYSGKYLNLYGIPGSPNCKMDKETNQLTDGCKRIPPGWDHWLGLIGNSQYYNYGTIHSDSGNATPGTVKRHGKDYNLDYFPDVIANFTMDRMRDFIAVQKKAQDDNSDDEDNDHPFLIVAAWPTAHMPFTPAPWAEHAYDDAKAWKTTNYNASWESQQSKHWMMRWLAPIDPATEAWMDQVYQNRTEALLSVDAHIQQFVDLLEQEGVYDDTYILYTSDNGWQLGQHRLSYDKRQLYEHDLRVPFIMTGPGVKASSTSQDIVLNVDIAPTLIDLALADGSAKQEAWDHMDGESILCSLLGGDNEEGAQKCKRQRDASVTSKGQHDQVDHDTRTDFLVSYHGRGYAQCDNFWQCPAPKPNDSDYHMGDWSNNTYHCVRTMVYEANKNKVAKTLVENSIYCTFLDDESFVEYYDIISDPWQLVNSYDALNQDQKLRYERRLHELRHCQGITCHNPNHGQGNIQEVTIS